MIRAKRNIAVFLAALILDRATKCWALSRLSSASEDFLSLTLRFNRGVSFSLLTEHPRLSLGVALLGPAALGFACLKSRRFRAMPGLALLFAGATGNLWDRLLYGHVVDWIRVGRPVDLDINLADVWLGIGCLLLIRKWNEMGGPP